MNEITTIQENGGALATTEDYKQIAIHWLESTGNLKKFNEQQKNQFIDICCAYGLNPIKKEVYGIPYGDKFNLIVGYESYIKRAERSGRLDGWGVEIIGHGNDMKAVITINRKDWTKPFIHEVYFEEYNTNQNLWKSKPRTMLKKVAIAQGFRMCFSEELGGMPYTADELPEEMTTETAPTVKVATTSNNNSESTPKNFNGKEKLLTIKTEKPAQAYTTEQATELGKVVNAQYENGESVFNDVEKTKYRNDLKAGNYENAIEEARDILNRRLDEYEAKVSETLAAEVMDEQ